MQLVSLTKPKMRYILVKFFCSKFLTIVKGGKFYESVILFFEKEVVCCDTAFVDVDEEFLKQINNQKEK